MHKWIRFWFLHNFYCMPFESSLLVLLERFENGASYFGMTDITNFAFEWMAYWAFFPWRDIMTKKFVTWHTLDKLSMAKSAFLSHMNWKRRNTRFLVCYSSLTPRIWRAKIYLIFEKIIERGCKMCAWVLHQFNTLERAKNPKILKKNRGLGASVAAVGRVKEQKHARSLE